jgi:hypothetical protein
MSKNTFNLTLGELSVVRGSLEQLKSVSFLGDPVKLKNSREFRVTLVSDNASEMLKIQGIIENLQRGRLAADRSDIPKSLFRRIREWFYKRSA